MKFVGCPLLDTSESFFLYLLICNFCNKLFIHLFNITLYKKVNFFIFSLQRWPLKGNENENEKFGPLCFPLGDTEGGGRRGGTGVMMLGWSAIGRPFDSSHKALLCSTGLFHQCVCMSVCVYLCMLLQSRSQRVKVSDVKVMPIAPPTVWDDLFQHALPRSFYFMQHLPQLPYVHNNPLFNGGQTCNSHTSNHAYCFDNAY